MKPKYVLQEEAAQRQVDRSSRTDSQQLEKLHKEGHFNTKEIARLQNRIALDAVKNTKKANKANKEKGK